MFQSFFFHKARTLPNFLFAAGDDDVCLGVGDTNLGVGDAFLPPGAGDNPRLDCTDTSTLCEDVDDGDTPRRRGSLKGDLKRVAVLLAPISAFCGDFNDLTPFSAADKLLFDSLFVGCLFSMPLGVVGGWLLLLVPGC